jgi:DNA (cytosine-5)-methyltransferase 1
MLTFGELFAGIGGFSLGLKRAGMKCKWQVEIDPYATEVLKKHWPEVPKHDDVRTFPPQGDHAVDVICGGFPCQDISLAGKGAGLAGARSGLWYEFARIIGDIRPRYVIVENVAALLARGMATVLGDLSTLGYDAEWHVISAASVGAPHRRDRVWIVAVRNANSKRETCDCLPDSKHGSSVSTQARRQSARVSGERHVADSKSLGGRARLCKDDTQQDGTEPCDDGRHVADSKRFGCKAESDGLQHSPTTTDRKANFLGSCRQVPSDADGAGRQQQRRPEPVPPEQPALECSGWWESEPNVGRVAHGVPSRVDRLRCLGNAVVPQIVEVIGRQIIAHEERVRTGRQRS